MCITELKGLVKHTVQTTIGCKGLNDKALETRNLKHFNHFGK